MSTKIKTIPDIDFPRVLRLIRSESNKTQKQMAKALGCETNAYQQWEHGKKTPNGQAAAKIILILLMLYREDF